MRSIHTHPKPFMNRVAHYGAAALLVVMVVAAVAQIALAVVDERARLLFLGGVFTLLLALPVLMLTTLTPALTVQPEGLTITPIVWKPIWVGWDAVKAVKDYPLLPPPDTESGRKLLAGAKRYRKAEGKMLVIPSLPTPYRIGGLFCGEGLTPVIAFTSRSHTDYDKLLKKILIYTEEAAP